jgi:hypothetical protein
VQGQLVRGNSRHLRTATFLDELRKAMTPCRQCLIQLTQRDLDLKLTSHHEDESRWAPRKISCDRSDFANSLRPGALTDQQS